MRVRTFVTIVPKQRKRKIKKSSAKSKKSVVIREGPYTPRIWYPPIVKEAVTPPNCGLSNTKKGMQKYYGWYRYRRLGHKSSYVPHIANLSEETLQELEDMKAREGIKKKPPMLMLNRKMSIKNSRRKEVKLKAYYKFRHRFRTLLSFSPTSRIKYRGRKFYFANRSYRPMWIGEVYNFKNKRKVLRTMFRRMVITERRTLLHKRASVLPTKSISSLPKLISFLPKRNFRRKRISLEKKAKKAFTFFMHNKYFPTFRHQIVYQVMVKFFRRKISDRNKKRIKKHKPFPTLTFYRTTSNLFYNLKDRFNRILHISSIGTFGLKGKKRYEPFGMRRVANDIALRFKIREIYKINVVFRSSIRKGVKTIMWHFRKSGIKINKIFDLIRMPHGNVRLPARKRTKRRRR